MSANVNCPHCAHGLLSSSAGKLEQCGTTYLPTTLWTCDTCGFQRYDPAVGTRWRALGSEEPAHVAETLARAA